MGILCNYSGNAAVTALFEGQTDHLVPSLSAALLECDLFMMAGRMVGHSAIHGGPTLSGLSPAVIDAVTCRAKEIVVISRKKAADTGSLLTHFICLALGLLSMKQMERNCIISHVERLVSWISIDMLPGVSGSSLLCTLDCIREAWPP